MNETQSPAVLKLRWEAAKSFYEKMQTAYYSGEVGRAAVDAADQAEIKAFEAWEQAVEVRYQARRAA